MAAELRVQLTLAQEEELHHGLSVDQDDGDAPWGRIEGGRARAVLVVTDPRAAIYRITSCRDIAFDNARPALERSLAGLARKVARAAYGDDSTVPPDVRRWL